MIAFQIRDFIHIFKTLTVKDVTKDFFIAFVKSFLKILNAINPINILLPELYRKDMKPSCIIHEATKRKGLLLLFSPLL